MNLILDLVNSTVYRISEEIERSKSSGALNAKLHLSESTMIEGFNYFFHTKETQAFGSQAS